LSLNRQLYGFSIYHAVNDGSLALVLAALPVMRVELSLSLVEIGTVLSAGLLATVVMQFAFGYLSDAGFTKHVLFAGLASIAVVNLVFVEATVYWQVLVFYVLLRGAAGVYHPVSFSSIFRTAQNKSASMGFQSAFGDASLAFAMATTGFIAESLGWRVPFILWGIGGVVAVFVFARLIGIQESRVEQTDPRPVTGAGVVSNSQRFTGSFLILQSSTVFLQCLYLIFSGFMPLFLNVRLGLSPGVSALVVAFWLAIGVLFTFNAGRFVGFFGGEKKTLKVCFGLTTAILTAATLLTLAANLLLVILALVILSGIPFFLAFPILYGMVGTTAPGKRLGLAYATNLSLSLVAGSVLSYAAGYLSSIYSLNVILPILVAAALAASLTAFFL
jgi:MFS family permease